MLKKPKKTSIFITVILIILLCIPMNTAALNNENHKEDYVLDVYFESINEQDEIYSITVITDYTDAEKFLIFKGSESITPLQYINNFTTNFKKIYLEDGSTVKVTLLDKNNKSLMEKEVKVHPMNSPLSSDKTVTDENSKNDEVVLFKDKYFENTIRKILGKTSGNITRNDVCKINSLSLDEEIEDLQGIQFFNNLTLLKIKKKDINSIKNINSLGNLPKLTSFSGEMDVENGNIEFVKNMKNLNSLTISHSKIKNISAVSNLTKLKNLNMSFNNISDISALSNILSLQDLHMSNNNISDISSLKKLTNLNNLNIESNKIKDISALEKLNNIQYLYLDCNETEDISPLKNMHNLIYLNLQRNNITNIETLRKLSNLHSLILSDNNIIDYSPVEAYYDNLHYKDFNIRKPEKNEVITVKDSRLSRELSRAQDEGHVYKEYVKTLENLEIINEVNNYYSDDFYVQDLDGIEYLENVKEIKLVNNKIKNIGKLKYLKNIETLDLSNNEIEDISALKELTNLKFLKLSRNCISDISPLKELTNLEHLDLGNNNINDISALKGLYELTCINLNYNNISNINPLEDLKNLTDIYLKNNKVKDISVLDKLSKLYNIQLANNKLKEISSIPKFYDRCSYKDLKIKKLSSGNYKLVSEIDSYYKLFDAIKYDVDFEIKDEKIKEVYNEAQKIISKVINDNMTDMEKELALHDYVVKNTLYDYENYLNDTIPLDSYSPYGILIKGTGVCEGYAETMNLLLNMVGIDSRIISGEANGSKGWQGHAWNIVKLDGEYYHLDATWDDPAVTDLDTGTRKEILRYDYFNLTDEQMETNHKWFSKIKCSGQKYNYNYYSYCKKLKINIDDFKKIHGTITAPENGMSYEYFGTPIKIWAESSDSDKYNKKKGFTNLGSINISEDKNSAEYTLIVPNDGKKYKVYYEYNNYKNNYVPKGYYTKYGDISEDDEDTFLSLKKDNRFDFNLLKGRKSALKISLPEGRTAAQRGLQIILDLYSNNGDMLNSYHLKIPEGENSIETELTGLKTEGEFYIYYRIGDDNCPYMKHGYYSKNGTTTDKNNKTFLDENVDSIELDIPSANAIQCEIKLPNEEKAPEVGVGIQIFVKEYETKKIVERSYIEIPARENSTLFTLPLEEGKYYIEYTISNNSNYCKNGYYKKDGCSPFYKDITAINTEKTENIVMILVKGEKLQGTISLPGKETAEDFIKVSLTFSSYGDHYKNEDYYNSYYAVAIPKGSNSVDFSLFLPECSKGFNLSIQVRDDLNEYAKEVYYTKNKLIKDRYAAESIKVHKDNNIKMTLIKN